MSQEQQEGKITFPTLSERGECNIPVPVYYLQSVIPAIIQGNIARTFYYAVCRAANSSGLTGYVPVSVYYAVCYTTD